MKKKIENQGLLFPSEELFLKKKKDGPTTAMALPWELESLSLSVRALNCLKKINVNTIEDLLMANPNSLLHIRNLGRKTFSEIETVLQMLKSKTHGKSRIAQPINSKHRKYPQLLRDVSELGLSRRVTNYFKTADVKYIGDLVTRRETELLKGKNLGRKSVREIKIKLSSIGLSLNLEIADWPPTDMLEKKKAFAKQIKEINRSQASKLIKAIEKQASYLEDELEAILKHYMKGTSYTILKELYGWDGTGEKTLETVGIEYGVTRERVRQIREKFERAYDSSILRYANLPILRKALRSIEDNMPAEETKIMSILLSQGITKSEFNLDGVSVALRIFQKKPAFRIDKYKSHRFVFPTDSPEIVRRSLSLALRSASKYGIANVQDISSQIQETSGLMVDTSIITTAVSLLRPDFKWLDEQSGWFWLENIPRNRLLNVIKKVLSTNNQVDISELRAGIARFHRMEGIVPPRAILLELCKQLPWCRLDGRRIIANPLLDWDKELKGSIEWAICAVFKQTKSLMTYDEFRKECLSIGINENSFKSYASYSPIVLRYAPCIYGLIGTEILPGEIDSFVSKIKRDKPLSEYGWTDAKEIWLARQITKGAITYGSLYLPASLKRFIDGEYKLKSVDGYSFGTITAKDNHIVGMRNFFNRRGAEPGDCVALVFSLSSKEAKAYVGNEELFAKFDHDIIS